MNPPGAVLCSSPQPGAGLRRWRRTPRTKLPGRTRGRCLASGCTRARRWSAACTRRACAHTLVLQQRQIVCLAQQHHHQISEGPCFCPRLKYVWWAQTNPYPATRFALHLELLEPADLRPWMCAPASPSYVLSDKWASVSSIHPHECTIALDLSGLQDLRSMLFLVGGDGH